jgi:hypothetical protein
MLFVIFDRSSEYLMPYVNAITSVFATIILAAFAYKFAKWYTLSKKKLVVLLYFLTVLTLAIMIAADLALKYVITTTVEESAPGEVSREKFLYKDFEGGELLKQDIEPNYTISYIVPLQFLAAWQILNNYPGMLSFIFRWGATAVTLNHYQKNKSRINRAILLALLLIPIILYLVGKSPDLFNVSPEPWTRPFSVTNIQQTFGIAAHSLVLLSSYLFVIGLYYAAISISHDARLRHSIKSSVSDASSDLLHSAGQAETQQQIEREVLKIAKKQSDSLSEQSGVRPSLEEQDMKNYLEEILPEVQKSAGR